MILIKLLWSLLAVAHAFYGDRVTVITPLGDAKPLQRMSRGQPGSRQFISSLKLLHRLRSVLIIDARRGAREIAVLF